MKLGFSNWTVILVCLTAMTATADERWPQFRGPRGDGTTNQSQLPLTWSETENVQWKTPIHDKGWSSPVVWGDQIWLTTATIEGHKMYAVCVDRQSGKVIHDILVFENAAPEDTAQYNSFASPTPVLEDGRVYVHFGSYGCACLDTETGEALWKRRDIRCNHWRGPGSSPVVAGALLITAYDGYDLQFVIALDKHTGKTVWKRLRNIDYGTDNGDFMKAFSTGALFEFGGRRQLVSPSAVATICYDAATGEELWKVRHGGMNAAVRPVYGNGLVYITSGSNKTLLAIRPGGRGDVTDTHVAWTLRRSVPKRPSPMLVGQLLFLISDDGAASCLSARSGAVIWQQRVAGGEFRASPIHAAGRIYLFNLNGQCPVIRASTTFEHLATNQLDHGCYASPAVVGDALYVRSTKHLYCISAGD